MAMHKEFLGFEYLSDALLRTEDGFEFPIHRALLAMRSEYFHELLCHSKPNDKVILIPGIQGSTMEIVIGYIYTGKISTTGHNIRDILLAAYFLGIDKLLQSSRILAVRSLTTSNCVPLFQAACRIEELGILKACTRFIVVNFESIVRDTKSRFDDLALVSLEQFLVLDNLNVSSEYQVWEAVICWVRKNPEQRTIFMKNLIQYIRFHEMCNDLVSDILDHPFVKENPCYDELHMLITNRQPTFRPRIPKKIFIFTKLYVSRSDYEEGIKVFITYDEDIDFWRKISSRIFCPDVVLHVFGPLIMMFDTMMNIIYTFDIISKIWSSLSPLLVPRKEYNVVKLGSHIYALGGLSPATDTDDVIAAVERYNFDSGRWEFSKPHDAVSQGSAVAIDNHIYVIGTVSGFFCEFLVSQVYNPDTDTWNVINSPQVYRRQFALEVYKNQIYVLGGHSSDGCLKSVEVYKAEENMWYNFQDLPFPYFLPKAVTINGVLYVYDNHSGEVYDFRCPPVRWDESSNKWQVVEASSSFCDLHLYQFCSIEDPGAIMAMRLENRDPCTEWVSSPFFTHQ